MRCPSMYSHLGVITTMLPCRGEIGPSRLYWLCLLWCPLKCSFQKRSPEFADFPFDCLFVCSPAFLCCCGLLAPRRERRFHQSVCSSDGMYLVLSPDNFCSTARTAPLPVDNITSLTLWSARTWAGLLQRGVGPIDHEMPPV